MIVYKITNKKNNKCYIGITTKSLEERWKGHITHSTHENKKRRKIYYAIKKHGIEYFEIQQIDTATTKEELLYKESFYIEKYNSFINGYNMNQGGTGLLYHTEESKQKMSENNFWKGKNRSGEKNPMFGKTHTEEVKEKISNVNKNNQYRVGKKHSDETKLLMAERAKGNKRKLGKKVSEEGRKNISIAQKNRNNENYTKRRYKVIDPDGKEYIINNMSEFCKTHNISHGNMTAVLKKIYKSTKGYYAEEIFSS